MYSSNAIDGVPGSCDGGGWEGAEFVGSIPRKFKATRHHVMADVILTPLSNTLKLLLDRDNYRYPLLSKLETTSQSLLAILPFVLQRLLSLPWPCQPFPSTDIPSSSTIVSSERSTTPAILLFHLGANPLSCYTSSGALFSTTMLSSGLIRGMFLPQSPCAAPFPPHPLPSYGPP